MQCYARHTEAMLRRPVEPGMYAGVVASHSATTSSVGATMRWGANITLPRFPMGHDLYQGSIGCTDNRRRLLSALRITRPRRVSPLFEPTLRDQRWLFCDRHAVEPVAARRLARHAAIGARRRRRRRSTIRASPTNCCTSWGFGSRREPCASTCRNGLRGDPAATCAGRRF